MPGFNIPSQADSTCGFSDIPTNNTLSTSTLPLHTVETIRSHRYKIEVLSDFDKILMYAHRAQRPIIEFDRMVINNGLEEIYRPGKYRWQPITVTFYEIVDKPGDVPVNTTAETIYKWVNSAKGVADFKKSIINKPVKPDGYLRDLIISLEDGLGKSAWKYQLFDAWPMNITPDELDYSSSSIQCITLTISYNKALEINPNVNP
jgi:hypothetical protein